MGVPPRLDFAALIERTQEAFYRIHEKKQLLAHLERAGVIVRERSGGARFVDPHWIGLAQGDRLRADRFIGASATGVQLASVFNAFGSRVHFLEPAQRILPAEDELISWSLTDAFEQRGITVESGIDRVDRIEPTGERLSVTTAGVAAIDRWRSVPSSGRSAGPGNVESLGLEAAGVATDRGFVAVDDVLRTSAEHIFAAGDVTGRMMLVQSATFQARLAVENVLSGAARPSRTRRGAPRRLHRPRVRRGGTARAPCRRCRGAQGGRGRVWRPRPLGHRWTRRRVREADRRPVGQDRRRAGWRR